MPISEHSISATDVAVRFLRLVEARRIDDAAELIDEAAQWWVQGIGEARKQDIRGAHGRIMEVTEAISFDIHQTIEQDDTVAVTTTVTYRFKDGTDHASRMCVIFAVAAGRLLAAQEYMNPSVHKFFMPHPA